MNRYSTTDLFTSMLMFKRVLLMFLLAVPLAGAAQLPDFTELVEKQGPAVVNISTTQSVRNPLLPQAPNLQEDDPFYEFFRRFIPQPGPEIGRASCRERG